MGNVNGVPDTDKAGLFSKEDIAKFKKKFNNLDKDKSGTLEPEELLSMPSLAKNPLVSRVITVFDENRDGKISFEEFLGGVVALSTGSDEEKKLRFVFRVYDIDADGFISNGDLFKTLKMMVSNKLDDVQLQQLVDRTIARADLDGDGMLSFEEFRQVVDQLGISQKLTIKYE